MSCAFFLGGSSSRLSRAFQGQLFLNRNRSSSAKLFQASFLDGLRENLERSFSSTGSNTNFYTVGITGSSGLLGTAILDELNKQGSLQGKPIRIVQFRRGETMSTEEFSDSEGIQSLTWNPHGKSPESVVDLNALASCDAVIHLAGENVATGMGPLGFLGIRPWTDAKKAEIVNSRVIPTKALASAIAACSTPIDFLVASGVGAYGADFIGEESPLVDESADTSKAGGFLAHVSRDWEAAAAIDKNNRVVNLRMGVILSKLGGALAKLYPIFNLGGGGIVGSGKQFFSFVSARDAARAYVHVLKTPSLSGPINVCAPVPCTNSQFTKSFGRILNRPTILPLPELAVKLLFGEMGEEMLLGGVRAAPGKLEASGFKFEHPTILKALQSAVDETI